jgi:hypothetical protein
MAVLKVKDANGNWLDITGTGQKGDPGGPVPTGGEPGELIQKTGPADFEVGWTVRPRVAFREEATQVTSSPTAGAYVPLVAGQMTVYPARIYHFFAGVRAIQDAGAVKVHPTMRVICNGVNLLSNDHISPVNDADAAWGSWSQTYLFNGTSFVVAGDPPTTVDVALEGSLTVAVSKLFYGPRLYVIEY